MLKIPALVLFTLLTALLSSQRIETLYNEEEFEAIVKKAVNLDSLTSDECYMIGYSHYRIENDSSAIRWYDNAISKGLDDDGIHFYKGLALRLVGEMGLALESFQTAVDKRPNSQRNLVELGNTYFYREDFEPAIETFTKARSLPYALGMPYYQLPYVYHYQGEYEKALQEYYISADLIDHSDPVYLDIMMEIGVLEYTSENKHQAAAKAYEEVLSINPQAYGVYPKLMKCYNKIESYQKSDSLFNIYKSLFENKELPEELMSETKVAIDEFSWGNRKLISFKSLIEPKETLDEYYNTYLLDEKGEKIEMKFMTEKTFDLEPGTNKNLLCGRDKNGTHFTYPYGWDSANIPYIKFKEMVLNILDKKIKPSASSNFNKD